MRIVHTIHGLAFHPYGAWWRNRLYAKLEKRAALKTDALVSVADAMTHQAFAANDLSAGFLRRYEQNCRRTFRRRMSLNAVMRVAEHCVIHGTLSNPPRVDIDFA